VFSASWEVNKNRDRLLYITETKRRPVYLGEPEKNCYTYGIVKVK
jgi:hypothetical protein